MDSISLAQDTLYTTRISHKKSFNAEFPEKNPQDLINPSYLVQAGVRASIAVKGTRDTSRFITTREEGAKLVIKFV